MRPQYCAGISFRQFFFFSSRKFADSDITGIFWKSFFGALLGSMVFVGSLTFHWHNGIFFISPSAILLRTPKKKMGFHNGDYCLCFFLRGLFPFLLLFL